MRKFLLQLKVPFFHSPRPHLQDTVERFWFDPTAWHCDVMTSQHDAPKLIFSISACRCDRKMILFLFLWNFGLLSSKMLLVLYLHDDVMSWRHVMTSKTGGTLSQLVEVLERWFFFCFYSFPARLVWKCYRFCVCMMSWWYFGWWVYKLSSCMYLHDVSMSLRDVMTSLNLQRDINKRTVFIWACKCAGELFFFRFCDFFGGWTQLDYFRHIYMME